MAEKITKLSSRPLNQPHPSRLAPDSPKYSEILAAHELAMSKNQDGYIDPRTSLFVITAATHKARGACCDNNCRHCPYIE